MPKKEKTTKQGKTQDSAKPKPKFKPRTGPVEEIKIIRMAESDLEGTKKLEHVLTKIKGISWTYAKAIRQVLGFENKKLGDFTDEEINKIKDVLANPSKYNIPSWLYNKRKDPIRGNDYHLLSSDLRLSHRMDIESLKKVNVNVAGEKYLKLRKKILMHSPSLSYVMQNNNSDQVALIKECVSHVKYINSIKNHDIFLLMGRSKVFLSYFLGYVFSHLFMQNRT